MYYYIMTSKAKTNKKKTKLSQFLPLILGVKWYLTTSLSATREAMADLIRPVIILNYTNGTEVIRYKLNV